MRWKYILWITLLTLTHLLCWWLAICFCAVYLNTNNGWFFGSLVSILLDFFIIQLSFSLIYSIIRMYALKKASK